jgi:3-oxoacyl-[acyl-carrier protein] reductase
MRQSVAIVTGASQGIGRATALRLARDFSVIVLVARNEANLKETATEAQALEAETLSIVADLSNPDAAQRVIEKTVAAYGRIDALLNIAGAVPGIDVMTMTDSQWVDAAELKLHGARRLTVHAWPFLKASEGSVVFVSGNAAAAPKPATAAVGVINAAIDALAKAFAEQGIHDRVQVNSVQPGAILTARRRSMLEASARKNGITVEEAIDRFPEKVGIDRFGSAEEIADLMAFLVSPAARWMTGTVVRMDGGEVKSL